MMKLSDYKADIVISVSGGIVNGVFGPKKATVLLVDFDNIHEGDDLSVSNVCGTPDSKECRETVKEAIEIVDTRKTRYADVERKEMMPEVSDRSVETMRQSKYDKFWAQVNPTINGYNTTIDMLLRMLPDNKLNELLDEIDS